MSVFLSASDFQLNNDKEAINLDGMYLCLMKDKGGYKYYEVKERFGGGFVFDSDQDEEDLPDIIAFTYLQSAGEVYDELVNKKKKLNFISLEVEGKKIVGKMDEHPIIATKENVQKGQFFKLAGDCRTNYAYQVDELWDKQMCVKCENGIICKPYNEFQLMTLDEVLNNKVHPMPWNPNKNDEAIYIDDIASGIPLMNAVFVPNKMVNWIQVEQDLIKAEIL